MLKNDIKKSIRKKKWHEPIVVIQLNSRYKSWNCDKFTKNKSKKSRNPTSNIFNVECLKWWKKWNPWDYIAQQNKIEKITRHNY